MPALTLYFQVDGGDGETQYVGNFKLACISSPDLIQNHQRVFYSEAVLKAQLGRGLQTTQSMDQTHFYFGNLGEKSRAQVGRRNAVGFKSFWAAGASVNKPFIKV